MSDRTGPVTISIDPGGWAELENREEALAYEVAVARALRKLITIAWPYPEADRVAKVLAAVASIDTDVLPQYVDLFQMEADRRARLAADGAGQ